MQLTRCFSAVAELLVFLFCTPLHGHFLPTRQNSKLHKNCHIAIVEMSVRLSLRLSLGGNRPPMSKRLKLGSRIFTAWQNNTRTLVFPGKVHLEIRKGLFRTNATAFCLYLSADVCSEAKWALSSHADDYNVRRRDLDIDQPPQLMTMITKTDW